MLGKAVRAAVDIAAMKARIGAAGDLRNLRAFIIQEKIDNCGGAFARMEKVEIRPNGKICRRVKMVPMDCGHRACLHCGERMRTIAAQRMEYPWKSTITLTLPKTLSRDKAWEQMSSWVSRYMAAMKKWLIENEGLHVLTAKQKVRALEYAWVLENHESGYPHCHIVMARSSVGPFKKWDKFRRWGRSAWNKITGQKGKWWYIKELWDATATRRYITKYLNKASYVVWHYALIGKRRMWGTSIDADKPDIEGYRLEKIVQLLELPSASHSIRSKWISLGYRLVWETDYGCSEWERIEDDPNFIESEEPMVLMPEGFDLEPAIPIEYG